MIVVVTTVKVQPGKAEGFERLFLEIAAKVKAHEPGCLVYQLTRSQAAADTFKCIEFYRDQAAFDEHARKDYFLASLDRLGGFLAGEPVIEFLDPVE